MLEFELVRRLAEEKMPQTKVPLKGATSISLQPIYTSEAVITQERIDLLHEMKVTKGSRFNASKRLERRDKRIITITAFASTYVIVLTVFPLLFAVGEFTNRIIIAITIIFSLVILALSLLQYSNNDPVRAEQHHRCALEINALRRSLRATHNCSMEDIRAYSGQYDGIIQKYGINHDDIDFDKYKLEHPAEYPKSLTGAEEKATARRVGREQVWSKIAVFLMTSLVIAVITFGVLASPFGNELIESLVKWLRSL